MKNLDKLTRYCKAYIKGKASKVVPGEYHLVITEYTLASYTKNDGHIYRLGVVTDQSPYSSSVMACRKIPGQYHEGMVYLWFTQPQGNMADAVLDVFPLGTTDQDEADKRGAEILSILRGADGLGLYRKYSA